MNGFINGLYQMAAEAQKLLLPGMMISIVIAAISAMIQSENWRVIVKERVIMICVAAAIGFGATEIAKAIASWFM